MPQNPTTWPRVLWNIAKWLLLAIILAAIGRVFYQVLTDPELQKHPIDWDLRWFILSGGVYILGLGFSAGYWHWLMQVLGYRPAVFEMIRAYYIGHLGKYVPGKALVIIMRSAMMRRSGVPAGIGAATVVYETLTGMAAAALIAAGVVGWSFRGEEQRLWQVLALIFLAGVPVLPWVFNPLLRRLLAPFRQGDDSPIPPVRMKTLLFGLLLQSCNWLFLGGSLWVIVLSFQPESGSMARLLECTGFLCLATVVGFFTPSPGGLGVREYILMLLLSPTVGGDGRAAVIALLLRLVWVASEVVIAAALFSLSILQRKPDSGLSGGRQDGGLGENRE